MSSSFYVSRLTINVTATEQHDYSLTFPDVVEPKTRTKVFPHLEDSTAAMFPAGPAADFPADYPPIDMNSGYTQEQLLANVRSTGKGKSRGVAPYWLRNYF